MPPHVDDGWKSYLGPGGVGSLVVGFVTAVLGLGLPVLWRLRQVVRAAGRDQPQAADAILVLGRVLEDDQPSAVFRARLTHGAELWRQGLAPRIVVAGGLTGTATRSEAAAGREVLVEELDVPADAVTCEDRSRHTLENLRLVRETLRRQRWRRLLIVSDPLHLARIASLAAGLGLDCDFSPAADAAPESRVHWWLRAWREAALLHWYHAGVAYSRLFGKRDWLERVT